MSSLYCKAEDYPYYFKGEPRELSIYDSLAFVDNFGHTVEGQAGLVLKTLSDEVRRLNRVIHAEQVRNTADTTQKQAAIRNSYLTNIQPTIMSRVSVGGSYQGAS